MTLPLFVRLAAGVTGKRGVSKILGREEEVEVRKGCSSLSQGVSYGVG